jgi:hypothetical protein
MFITSFAAALSEPHRRTRFFGKKPNVENLVTVPGPGVTNGKDGTKMSYSYVMNCTYAVIMGSLIFGVG